MRMIRTCVLLLLLTTCAGAEEPRSVLARFVGRWTTHVVLDRRLPTPARRQNDGTAHSEWILNEQYVAFWSEAKSGERELQLVTWDAERKIFRSWLHESDGPGFEVDGTWDEATSTLHWKDVKGRFDILDHFEDGDLIWTLERRNEKGQVVYIIHGRCHRLPVR